MQSGESNSKAATSPTPESRQAVGVWPLVPAPLSSVTDNVINLSLLQQQVEARVGMVLFVSAGVSEPLGFSVWRPLESQPPDATVRHRVLELLNDDQYEEATEALPKMHWETVFQQVLAREATSMP